MRGLTFEIKGINALLTKMGGLAKETENEVDFRLKAFANDVVNDAKVLAPTDLGYLKNRIQADTTKRLEVSVNVADEKAAYVEFGTGSNVFVSWFNFTGEMKEYAAQFFVNGKGHMKAHPFLFPAYEMNRIKLIEKLKAFK